MKIFITALLLVSATIGNSQNASETVKNDFKIYIDAIVNQEFETAINYTLQDIFTIIPKEQMLTIMEQSFNNPEIEISLDNTNIGEVKTVEKIKDKYYAELSYSNDMYMRFVSDSTEVDELSHRLMLTNFNKTFGEENVSYNETDKRYKIFSEKKVLAVSEKGKDSWQFAVIENNMKPLLEMILPKEVMEKL